MLFYFLYVWLCDAKFWRGAGLGLLNLFSHPGKMLQKETCQKDWQFSQTTHVTLIWSCLLRTWWDGRHQISGAWLQILFGGHSTERSPLTRKQPSSRHLKTPVSRSVLQHELYGVLGIRFCPGVGAHVCLCRQRRVHWEIHTFQPLQYRQGDGVPCLWLAIWLICGSVLRRGPNQSTEKLISLALAPFYLVLLWGILGMVDATDIISDMTFQSVWIFSFWFSSSRDWGGRRPPQSSGLSWFVPTCWMLPGDELRCEPAVCSMWKINSWINV